MREEPLVVSGAVEGVVDEAVLRRLVRDSGHHAGSVYTKHGKSGLLEKLSGYNDAARIVPWVVLVDLDGDAECPPPFVAQHLPGPAPEMHFRVAVRQIEAWLLADRPQLARFLGVQRSEVPQHRRVSVTQRRRW